ncbi:MAG: YhcH/YjgK/YiaL family protein [Acidaminococcaceae bacterium]|jgi:biofilm protein TabA|nr:YhcH/YjgK/YiaL family protein [Acidaminococcaceae bacterium]
MIFLNIKQIGQVIPFVSPKLRRALTHLTKTDFLHTANGEYALDGREIFFRVNSYATEPLADRRAEKHFEYIDVQYIAAGTEMIGFAPFTPELELLEEHFKDDVAFYHVAETENLVVLHPGDIAIFFPWEVHRPNCQVGITPCEVKKVVGKIRL